MYVFQNGNILYKALNESKIINTHQNYCIGVYDDQETNKTSVKVAVCTGELETVSFKDHITPYRKCQRLYNKTKMICHTMVGIS